MFEEKIKYFIFNVITTNNIEQLINMWDTMEFPNEYKLMVSLSSYHKSIYPPRLKEVLSLEGTHFITYFKNNNIFLMSNEIINNMRDSKSYIASDYSIMFDTNYASYIDRFISDVNNANLSNEVYTHIDILLQNNFNYDFLFYLTENYYNIFVKNQSIVGKGLNQHKLNLYKNLVSLELFKSLDTEEYKRNKLLKFTISENEAKIKADDIFDKIFNSHQANDIMSMYSVIHKTMILLLIGILKIKFGDNKSASSKVEKLFDYISNVLGIYYERECIVAHKFFQDNKNVGIFNKFHKGMNIDKLYNLIENIAWDFSVPRIMQYHLQMISQADFFTPIFLTNDSNLRQLLKLFQVKGVLYSDKNELHISFPDFNSFEYFKSIGCNIERYFEDEVINQRITLYNDNLKNDFFCIERELDELKKILT